VLLGLSWFSSKGRLGGKWHVNFVTIQKHVPAAAAVRGFIHRLLEIGWSNALNSDRTQ
jgi:hypothetical protein